MKEQIKEHKKPIIISTICAVAVIVVVVLLLVFKPWAAENHDHAAANAKIPQNQAMQIAQNYAEGYLFHLEDADDEDGTVVYELEGIDQNGNFKELEIDGNTGKVLRDETEPADGKTISTAYKVTPQQAMATAQKSAPGYNFAVKELDDEDGKSNKAIYELTGINQSGTKMELEINANTGKIVKTEKE